MNPISTVQLVLAAVAATIGLVVNGYILLVLLWQRRFQTANHLLLFHLAVVDTLFCFLVLVGNTSLGSLATDLLLPQGLPQDPVQKQVAAFPPNSEGFSAYQIQGVFWTVLPIVLIWTICGLSCDRFLAISSPLHYSKIVNTRKAAFFLLFSWALGIVLAMTPFFGICSYRFSAARSSYSIECDPAGGGYLDIGFALIYCSLSIFVPIIIVFSCNLHMLLIARYQRHRIVSAIYEITLRAQATVAPQTSPSPSPSSWYTSKFKGRDALLTVAQLVCSLLFLVTPSYVTFLMESITGQKGNALLVSATTVLLTFIPSVNAYVYGVKSRLLRQTFKRLLQRYLYQQQASIEINRRLSLRSQSSLRAAIGWHSFLSTSTQSVSNELHRYQRRNSAPILPDFSHNHTVHCNCDPLSSQELDPPFETLWLPQTSRPRTFRRLSLTVTNSGGHSLDDSHTESRFPPFQDSGLKGHLEGGCRRLSFLSDPGLLKVNKQLLSPIEEVACPQINL